MNMFETMYIKVHIMAWPATVSTRHHLLSTACLLVIPRVSQAEVTVWVGSGYVWGYWHTLACVLQCMPYIWVCFV